MISPDKKLNADTTTKARPASKHEIGFSNDRQQEKVEDQALWIKIKLGNSTGFRELFLKYYGILMKMGHAICQDSDLVEDAIHDLFLYVWERRNTLSDVESVKYYLIVAFRRRLYRALGEQEKINKIVEGLRFEYPKYESFFEDIYVEKQGRNERNATLMNAVATLSPRQKQLIELRYVKGLSYKEIALQMSISASNARKLSYKAISKLRKTKL
jgi:RNA polymerase sigma-70 factor (ECF subfamily)